MYKYLRAVQKPSIIPRSLEGCIGAADAQIGDNTRKCQMGRMASTIILRATPWLGAIVWQIKDTALDPTNEYCQEDFVRLML